MAQTFKCANCPYAIDATGLNAIQLKALRMWAKTCPKCGKMSHWIEQSSLLETPKPTKTNGGSEYETNNKTISKTQSQKRRATGRYDH